MNKTIFIDIDGTIINSQRELTERTLAAVHAAQRAGHTVVICTGRTVNRAAEVTVPLGVRYIIHCNGAGIWDIHTNRAVYERPIPAADIVAMCEAAAKTNVVVSLCSNEARVFASSIPVFASRAFSDVIEEFDTITSLRAYLKRKDVLLVATLGLDIGEFKALKTNLEAILAERKSSVINVNQSRILTDEDMETEPYKSHVFVDWVMSETSKGSGIAKFCQIFGIAKSETIGIGDDINDMPMLSEVGISVAMGNAISRLKKVATYVTSSNDADGVAAFLEKMVLATVSKGS